jgi:EAL domain-containing protein (putative c-di-GMP-specific phosphodiesterase class I)
LEEGIGIGDFMTNTVACDPDFIEALETDSIAFGAASQFETELRRALDHEEFQVYYQPIVSLESSELKGFEALIRWQHPTRRLLFPADFLPVMERTGWIVPLGLWIVREASCQMHQWHRRFPDRPPLYLSVNISSKLFQEPDLVEQISQILNETGLNPSSLVLEITETLVMQNSEAARNILLQLRALSIRLAIDDFGTGYSSLSYLQRFPVHTLKIDQSFISRLQDEKESLEIVRAIVTLAHNLGLDVIAEGIEAAHHRALLKLLKCECGQGYFYSKAVDSEQAAKLIDKGILFPESAGASTMAISGLTAGSQIEKRSPAHADIKDVKNAFDQRDDALLKNIISCSEDRSLAAGTGSERDQKLKEEFEIHIENLKRDAIKQFDQELYTVCLPNFEFLCELEPTNRGLRDYFDLSRALVEQIPGHEKADSSQVDPRGLSLNSHSNQDPEEGSSQPSLEIEVGPKMGEGHSWVAGLRKYRMAFLGAITATVCILLVFGIRTQGKNGQKATTSEESKPAGIQLASDKARPVSIEEKRSVQQAASQIAGVQQKDVSGIRREPNKPSFHGQPKVPGPAAVLSVQQSPQSAADYSSLAVIHEHFLGSCSGLLRITRGTIVFEPSQDKRHAFAVKLADIVGTEHGETLRIKFARETYRFKAKSAKDKNDNLLQLASVDRKLTRLRAQVESRNH